MEIYMVSFPWTFYNNGTTRPTEVRHMNMNEYLRRLEELLRAGRMAPRDMEDALSRCTQYILNAGPEREAETIAEMGTPEEMAEEILADYRRRLSAKGDGLGLGWKIALGFLLSPVICAVYCAVFGLVIGGAVCVLAGGFVGVVGLGTLLSGGVGTLLVFVGGGCMAAGVGFLLLVGGLALCKGSNWCMGRLFGGRRTAA